MVDDKEPPEIEPTSHDEPDDLQYIVHHAALPETEFSRVVDAILKKFGDAVSWFWVLLMVVICVNVFMKNVLSQGSVQLEEIQWHIYAALFLLGLSYAQAFDDHVRVDLLYEGMSLKTKAWVDFLGILLFLIPFIVMLLNFTFPFVIKAFVDAERSNSPAGLSNYWVIKSLLAVGLLLLLVAVLGRLHRCIAYLFLGAEAPKPEGN